MTKDQTPVEWAKEQLLGNIEVLPDANEDIFKITLTTIKKLEANIERVFKGAEWMYYSETTCDSTERRMTDTHRYLRLAPEPLVKTDPLVEKLRSEAELVRRRWHPDVADMLLEAAERLEKERV